MVYRVIYTLTIGFTLYCNSVCLGQAETPPEVALPSNGAAGAPTTQANPPLSAPTNLQPPPSTDDASTGHWWQRFSPQPAGSAPTTSVTPAATAAPAPQAATKSNESTWYFGKLFKGSEKKSSEKVDPFAVKAVSYEEPVKAVNVPTAGSTDAAKVTLAPPADAATAPTAAPASNPPLANAASGYPYPDTGIQTLYPLGKEDAAATITDRATEHSTAPSSTSVRGAFSGLLGRDDARTQKEASSLPLLSPYKEVPAGYGQTAAEARAAKQSQSAASDKKTTIAETEKPIGAQTAGYADKATSGDKQQAVVGAAFTLPTSESKDNSHEAPKSVGGSGVTTALNQVAVPQPLALSGVDAHQLTGTPLNRPKVIYRPGASFMDNAGNKVIKPEVQVAADSKAGTSPNGVQLAQFAPAGAEGTLPPPANIAPETAFPIDDQQWMPETNGFDSGACNNCNGNFGHGWNHGRDCCRSGGIGVEHVAQAPFFIQTTEPFNNCRVRLDLARDLEFPDRSEYFWAKTPGGKGPAVTSNGTPVTVGETSVNYQDLDFYLEKGTKRLSIGVDLPIRAVDPEIRDDSTGFSDMAVRTKAVLMDGKNWQLTQLFNTYLPTGSVHHGTGNGHVSLEPGVAYRWRWSDWTYFHGDLKYLFPIAADPDFAGQIFNYGIGWSHVLIETDTYALIPTFEIENWTFVDGRQTLPFPINPAVSEEINTIGITNICPGLRWVCDKGCDCGTKEFGICAGISVTNEHLYDEILRLEFRWSH